MEAKYDKNQLRSSNLFLFQKMKHKTEASLGESSKWSNELERFTDERLQKLWEKAKSGMFSESELMSKCYSLFSP